MDSASLTRIGNAIRKAASAFAEHDRQRQQQSAPPNSMLASALVGEALALRAEGQGTLADALTVLATDIAEMSNG